MAGVVLASSGAYFGPLLWDAARRAAGEESLTVGVLYADQFRSPLHALADLQVIWNSQAADIPRNSTLGEARALGAVDANTTLVRLNLSSTFTKRVIIQRISVNIERREEPLRGVWVTGAMGGVTELRFIHVDLEHESVEWTDSFGKKVPPVTIYVDGSSEETVDILAEARNGHYWWNLELTYTVGGGEPQHRIVKPPDEELFNTSSVDNATVLDVSSGTCTEPWDRTPSPPPEASRVGDPLC